jgi:predicted Zn-dependent peptidase
MSDAQPQPADPQPRVTRLANGFTVASIAMPGLQTAAVSLDTDVGARHEGPHEHGLAHLFEHMVFKGTDRRSARAIAEEIEDAGGSLNAWTSRDSTSFHARVLGETLPLAVDILADMLLAPRFDPQDLEKEREVVLSEIGEALDTPDDLVFDHCQAVAFPGQSLGRAILGTPDSLAALDRAALVRWRDTHFRGPTLVLSAAGQVDHEALVAQAEALFGGLPADRGAAPPRASWGGGARTDSQRGEQLHLALGFEGANLHSPAYYAAQCFTMALGGGMSSRLFQELREERGLAYSVSAAHSPHTDTGLLSLYFAARPGDAAGALDLARKVARQTSEALEQAELDRARAQMKAGLLMGLESAYGRAEWLGRSLLFHGRIVPPAEMVAALNAVTVETARAAGAAMLETAPALAAVGPKADKLAA